MKKLIYNISTAILLSSLVACGSNNSDVPTGAIVEFKVPDSDMPDEAVLWVFAPNDTLIQEYHLEHFSQSTSQQVQLDPGMYTFVVQTNLKDDFTHNASLHSTTLNELLITQKEGCMPVEHVHYGVAQVVVEENKLTRQLVSLSRALAEITLSVNNLSEDVSSVAIEVKNTAKGYYPGQKKLHPKAQSISMGTLQPQNNTVTFEKVKLLPIAVGVESKSNALQTEMQFSITYASGEVISFDAKGPVLENGGVYTPDLEYDLFRPGITIELSTINGWKDTSPVFGEVLNPF